MHQVNSKVQAENSDDFLHFRPATRFLKRSRTKGNAATAMRNVVVRRFPSRYSSVPRAAARNTTFRKGDAPGRDTERVEHAARGL